MVEICPRYTQDMPKICPRYAQDIPQICPRYTTDMSGVCKKSKKILIAQDITNFCPRPAHGMPKICLTLALSIWHSCGGPQEHHSHQNHSNRQKASPAHPQIWHLSVLDPYSSIQTIIRVTAKKRDQLAPRFAPSVCMTHIPTLTPS